MKSISRWFLMAALAGLTLLGSDLRVSAQDQDRGGPGDRLSRLERRLDELAQRQEQLMRRTGAAPDQRGPMPGPGPEGMRPPMPPPGPQPVGMPPGVQPPGHDRGGHGLAGLLRLLLVVGLICNILLAVWIYTDIRKRGEGSGIFIALALVAGVPSAIIYSLVRIGDRKP